MTTPIQWFPCSCGPPPTMTLTARPSCSRLPPLNSSKSLDIQFLLSQTPSLWKDCHAHRIKLDPRHDSIRDFFSERWTFNMYTKMAMASSLSHHLVPRQPILTRDVSGIGQALAQCNVLKCSNVSMSPLVLRPSTAWGQTVIEL